LWNYQLLLLMEKLVSLVLEPVIKYWVGIGSWSKHITSPVTQQTCKVQSSIFFN
jgi:hypothetical protein